MIHQKMYAHGRLNSSVHEDNKDKLNPAPNRVFGKDITNLAPNVGFKDFKSKDIKIKDAENNKIERPRIHSEAITVKRPVAPKPEVCIVKQYEEDILNSLLRDSKVPQMQELVGVTSKMRTILIDWMVDVHASFELRERTLHMAFRLLDEFVTTKGSSKAQFQLVGITCLWIASKYEEIHPPRMKHFVEITANTYSAPEMYEMEMNILKVLNFNLVKTTPYDIINFIPMEPANVSFCQYAFELAALEGLSLCYSATQIMESAIRLADNLYKTKTQIPEAISDKNQKDDIFKCFSEFCRILSTEQKYNLKAIKRKYTKADLHNVGKIVLESKKPMLV